MRKRKRVGNHVEQKQMCVPIADKYLLTIEETKQYFNLGRDKIYELARIRGAEYVVHNGRNILINRKKLEEYLVEERYI